MRSRLARLELPLVEARALERLTAEVRGDPGECLGVLEHRVLVVVEKADRADDLAGHAQGDGHPTRA